MVEREFGARRVIAALIVGDEPLGAVLLPLHRPLEFAARPDDERLLGIDEGLHAECAADIGRDQPQRLLGDFEHHFGQRVAHEVRTLGRRIEGRAAARRVKVGNGVARLHRVRHDAVVDEIERGDVRGLGEGGVGRLGVAEVVVPVEHQVAGNMIEQPRCIGSERVRGIGHRRQHIVLDLDGLGGVARGGHGLGHDKGDRLTDVSHLALRQHRTGRVVARRAVAIDEWHQAADVAETVGARVLAGRHEQHAGHAPRRGGVDTLDVRVGHRRAQHERLRRVRQIDVVGVAALPGNETQIFVTPHRLPDSEFHAVSSRPFAPRLAQARSGSFQFALRRVLKHLRARHGHR